MTGRIGARFVKVANIPIAVSNPEAAAELVCSLTKEQSANGNDVHLVNAYTISLAAKNNEYARVLQHASYNYPDGKPVSIYAKAIDKMAFQVRGPQLFADVLNIGRQHGLLHFLLGSTPETLALLQRQIERRFPGVQVVGSYSPPFRPLSDEEIRSQDELVRKSGANVVWIGLGTPKQDYEAQRTAAALGITTVAVGAAFDFMAGTKKEAPQWMSRIGVEWLFRFASEPGRLWRRYLMGNFVFISAVLKGSGIGARALSRWAKK